MKILKPISVAVLFSVLFSTMCTAEVREEGPHHSIWVTIFGAVQKPCVTELPDDCTILSALAAAGGWSNAAKVDKVVLLRGEPGKKLERTECNIKAILAGAAPAVALHGGDVVFVEERLY